MIPLDWNSKLAQRPPGKKKGRKMGRYIQEKADTEVKISTH